MTIRHKCDKRVELPRLDSAFCGRIAGHKGYCSGKVKVAISIENKRVETEAQIVWLNRKTKD
jgi:hypothetical protein